MNNDDSTRYGVDKIEFLSIHHKDNVNVDLRAIRPISRELGTITVHELTKKQSKELYEEGFRSKIILSKISQPAKPELFEKLQKVDFLFRYPHVVEIFKDMVCKDSTQAISLADYLIDRVYMIYKHGVAEPHIVHKGRFETYRKIPSKIKTEEQLDNFLYPSYAGTFEKNKNGKYVKKKNKEYIGTKILYLAPKKDILNFVIYARLSKRDRKPVAHSEFRFRGNKEMQKLRILDRENGTLFAIQHDLMLHAPQIYEENLEKRIRFKEINWDKLARLSFGWQNRKNLNQDEKKRLELCVKQFQRQIPLYTAGFAKYAEDIRLEKRLYLQ